MTWITVLSRTIGYFLQCTPGWFHWAKAFFSAWSEWRGHYVSPVTIQGYRLQTQPIFLNMQELICGLFLGGEETIKHRLCPVPVKTTETLMAHSSGPVEMSSRSMMPLVPVSNGRLKIAQAWMLCGRGASSPSLMTHSRYLWQSSIAISSRALSIG